MDAIESTEEVSEKKPKPVKSAKKKKKKTKVVRGRATASVSAGSKYDAAEAKSGSHQDPEVASLDPLPLREVEEHNYSKVVVALGMTRSLGNYEFARVDVTVEDFCAVDKKDETFELLHKTTTAYLGKVMKDVDGFLRKKREREAPHQQPSVLTEVKT